MLKLVYAIHPLFTGSGKVVEPIEGFQRFSRPLTPLRNIPDTWKTDRRVGKDGFSRRLELICENCKHNGTRSRGAGCLSVGTLPVPEWLARLHPGRPGLP